MAEQITPVLDYVPHHCSQSCTFVRHCDDPRGPQDCLDVEDEEAGDENAIVDDVEAARRSMEYLSSGLSVAGGRWPVPSYADIEDEPTSTTDAPSMSVAGHYDLFSSTAGIDDPRSDMLPPKKRTSKASSAASSSSSSAKSSRTRPTRSVLTACFTTLDTVMDSGHGELPESSSSLSKPPESKSQRRGGANSASHQCPECQKVFGSAGKLQQHLYVHSGERPFVCSECSKGFSSRFKLMRHALIHAPPGERRYKCVHCERSFHRKDHLKNHCHVHDPNKATYKCPECPKEYNSRLSYRKHVAVHAAHSGDLECKVCLKRFASTDEIVFHLKVHSGSRTIKTPIEKKFKCEFCERRFFTRKDVKRHLVVHTGRRDFLCQICPQRFGRKDHLVRHIKKSHHHLHHLHHHHHQVHHHPAHHHLNPRPHGSSEVAAAAAAATSATFAAKTEKEITSSTRDEYRHCARPETPVVASLASADFCHRPAALSPSLELVFRHPSGHHCDVVTSASSSMFSTCATSSTVTTATTTTTPSSTPAFLIHSLSMDMEYKLYEDIKIEREHDDPNDIGQLFGFLPLSLSIPPLHPSTATHQQLHQHHHHQQHHPLSATLVQQQDMSGGHDCQATAMGPPDGDMNDALPQFDQAFQ